MLTEVVRFIKEDDKYLRLVNIITNLENNNALIEDEGYKQFVINDLNSIIGKCSKATKAREIAVKYYQLLTSSDDLTIRYLLTFLQKHQLMEFYTCPLMRLDAPRRLYASIKEDLDLGDIVEAYENEVVSMQKEKANNHMKIILSYKK